MDRVKVLLGQTSGPHRGGTRAVIVGGCRTPFVKAFGSLAEVDAIGLGVAAVRGLLERFPIDPALVDDLIWGNVVVNSAAPNVAREIVLDLNLPRSIPGVTVSRACLSGLQAIEQAVVLIESGHADVVIAGGSDSTSNGEMPVPRRLTRALGRYALGGGRKAGWAGVAALARDAGPVADWVPKPNQVAERCTGQTMGYHADLMAEINAVPRDAQDRFAAQSHERAAAAQRAGLLADEIVAVRPGPDAVPVERDDLVRADVDAARIARLPTAFRPAAQHGTVTAASSSALTDGASAVLVMSAERARSLGLPGDIAIVSFATCAVDPYPQLLIAPVFAIPRALNQAGITLDDIDLFEIHEAFAAQVRRRFSSSSSSEVPFAAAVQVLSSLRVLESESFARQYLGTAAAVAAAAAARIPRDKINPNGGSIAIGHPFAATGGRLVIAASNHLRRTGKRYALLSICAAGGIGGVAILERQAQ